MVQLIYQENCAEYLNYSMCNHRWCSDQLAILATDIANFLGVEIPARLKAVAEFRRGQKLYGVFGATYKYTPFLRDNGTYDVLEDYEICPGNKLPEGKEMRRDTAIYGVSKNDLYDIVNEICNNFKKVTFDMLGSYSDVKSLAENQIVTYFNFGRVLKSYDTIVAMILDNGQTYLDPKYNVSQTTSKYVNRFLGIDTKSRANGIKEGSISIMQLNSDYCYTEI